ncbi:MAG TPA: proline iminopeptidase-family hydrolase [Pseudoflavonifractor sp.]|nr:proline iminopeptidase-family hydrolase [Pseudoflavonifractor sp.]
MSPIDRNTGIAEGTIAFRGGYTWYRRVGKCESGKSPLLVLHGGPGMGHEYLKSLDDLADEGREVIYYDQLGCGNSAMAAPDAFWDTPLWQEEIDVVRAALNLREVHILGQSWGGMLAMQYAIAQPQGVKSMVIASSPASMALWESEAARLVGYLEPRHRQAIEIAAKTGEYSGPEYSEAMAEYYRRHVCMLEPYPEYVKESFQRSSKVYAVMQGPSEFTVLGKLKNWDITGLLHTIKIPTLLTSGVMDEATPYIVKQIYDRIPNCEWELLMGTHLVHAECREPYNRLVERFLQRVERHVTGGNRT